MTSKTASLVMHPALEVSSAVDQPEAALAHTAFHHLTDWHRTQSEVEAFLKNQGHPPHAHTAELIMFMEVSFAGKYRKGERSHYQRIMPGRWREGDTVSEKLTRCKDKETFKARFDRIGTTAILSRGHYEKREVTNLDFKGRLYLRLIDTKRKNLSIFYRNDAAVVEFFKAAHAFYRQKNTVKTGSLDEGKAEGPEPTKPTVKYLENPKPLLTKGLTRKEAYAPQGHLTLIHSSSGEKKEKDKRVEIGPLLIPDAPAIGKAAQCAGRGTQSHTAAPDTRTPGLEAFHLWRSAVMSNDPSVCLSESPTSAQLRSALSLKQKFDEFFLEQSLREFFHYLTKNWPSESKFLKGMGVWKSLGDYPELRLLDEESDKVLTRYKREFLKAADLLKAKQVLVAPQSPKQAPAEPIQPPYIGCKQVTAAGRTFRGGEPESLEYQAVAYSRFKSGSELATSVETLLKSLSVDLAASNARILELRELPEAEIERYCC